MVKNLGPLNASNPDGSKHNEDVSIGKAVEKLVQSNLGVDSIEQPPTYAIGVQNEVHSPVQNHLDSNPIILHTHLHILLVDCKYIFKHSKENAVQKDDANFQNKSKYSNHEADHLD